MAVAEARSAGQRAATRCFMQEDAKRAPKLACCQSSSSTSKHVCSGPANEADGPHNVPSGFMPNGRKSSYSNLPPDTRWWMQLQSSHGSKKDSTYEQIKTLEGEESLKGGTVHSTSKDSVVQPQKWGNTDTGVVKSNECSLGIHCGVYDCAIMEDVEAKKKSLCNNNAQELLKTIDTVENCSEVMEMDFAGCSLSKQSTLLHFDPESSWFHSEKTEPWWRTMDMGELASLVAQKSLDHVENCDLPPPQKICVMKQRHTNLGCVDNDEVLFSALDQKVRSSYVSLPTLKLKPCHGCRKIGGKDRGLDGHVQFGSDKSFSSCTTHKNIKGMQVSDPSKDELLEALRHSQTRAREAEKEAKQACAEREHLIKLFFRQASQLFAYKQWFRLLQLQSLYLLIKNRDNTSSTLFPVVLPCDPYKGFKRSKKRKGHKLGSPGHESAKHAVSIALGLGLVGAGLLLGWTVGWMLPSL